MTCNVEDLTSSQRNVTNRIILYGRSQANKFVLLALIILYATSAYAINCDRTSNFAEQSICQDQFLMRLDQAMNENYKFMFNSNIGSGAINDLKQSQKKWIRKRNGCLTKLCVLNLYKSRLSEICDYPVITGVHPICTDYDDILENFPNQPTGGKNGTISK